MGETDRQTGRRNHPEITINFTTTWKLKLFAFSEPQRPRMPLLSIQKARIKWTRALLSPSAPCQKEDTQGTQGSVSDMKVSDFLSTPFLLIRTTSIGTREGPFLCILGCGWV